MNDSNVFNVNTNNLSTLCLFYYYIFKKFGLVHQDFNYCTENHQLQWTCRRIILGAASEMHLLYKFLIYKANYLSDRDMLLYRKRTVAFSEVIQGYICP